MIKERVWMNTLVQAKRLGNLLDEVLDLSRQMAEALNRGDEVVVQMLMEMRAEPIHNLKLTDQVLRSQKEELSGEDGERLAGLLNGTIEPESKEETMLARQADANRRLHQKVMELERILNKKIAREKSIY